MITIDTLLEEIKERHLLNSPLIRGARYDTEVLLKMVNEDIPYLIQALEDAYAHCGDFAADCDRMRKERDEALRNHVKEHIGGYNCL